MLQRIVLVILFYQKIRRSLRCEHSLCSRLDKCLCRVQNKLSDDKIGIDDDDDNDNDNDDDNDDDDDDEVFESDLSV